MHINCTDKSAELKETKGLCYKLRLLTYSVDMIYQSIVGVGNLTMLAADFTVLIASTAIFYYIAYKRFIRALT